MKTLNGADITFIATELTAYITIETFEPYTFKEVKWRELTIETLKEIVEIITNKI